MIAVQMRKDACDRSGLGRNDVGDRDRAGSLPQPREHGAPVLEWVDHYPLASDLKLHASPAKPPDAHPTSIDR